MYLMKRDDMGDDSDTLDDEGNDRRHNCCEG
jgi:hypothetical protein